MFPPFFNATSTARVLSLLLHFLKQIFSGPHFQDIAYQPKAASRSAAGKAAKRSFSENRDMVFPIPLYEITMSNGSIVQNPGWN